MSNLPVPSQKDLDQIIDDAGLLSSDEMAERLEITRKAINRWRREDRVIGFEMARRGFRYPPEQVGPRRTVLEGIPQILEAFDGDNWSA